MTLIYVLSIVLYTYFLFRLRGKWIEQNIVFLIIYLSGLTVVGEMDILLPIYFVFSVIPFIIRLKRISYFTGFIALYIGIYTIIGLLFQNKIASITTFIAKIWQFCVFFLVYESDVFLKHENEKKIITIVIVVESILGIYLLNNSNFIESNGLIRLVSNSQPITGNIGTVALPIIVYYYFCNRNDRNKTKWVLIVSIMLFGWAVLSGTRGYTLEFGFSLFFVFYDYFTNKNMSSITQKNRIFVLIILGISTGVAVILIPSILEKMFSVLRIGSSVGIRTYENRVCMEFFRESNLLTKLVGIGFGGSLGNNEIMQSALYKQFSKGMWNQAYYLRGSGAIFHNLYANLLITTGLLGIGIFALVNIRIWKIVSKVFGNNPFVQLIIHLFHISFLLMNYYRWSAICGIGEMIVLALIVKRNKILKEI